MADDKDLQLEAAHAEVSLLVSFMIAAFEQKRMHARTALALIMKHDGVGHQVDMRLVRENLESVRG